MGIMFLDVKTNDDYKIHYSGLDSLFDIMKEIGLEKEINLLAQQEPISKRITKRIYKKLKPYTSRILYYTNNISINSGRCLYCGTKRTGKECPTCGKLYDTQHSAYESTKKPVYLREFITFLKDADSVVLC